MEDEIKVCGIEGGDKIKPIVNYEIKFTNGTMTDERFMRWCDKISEAARKEYELERVEQSPELDYFAG